MAIQWTQDLSVGVAKIDKQHRNLFDKVNGLLSAMGQGKDKNEVGEITGFVQNYVLTHFQAEEKLMEQHGYPAHAAHKLQHADFVREFAAMKHEIETGALQTAQLSKVQRQLGEWLTSHIAKTDRAFAGYLVRH